MGKNEQTICSFTGGTRSWLYSCYYVERGEKMRREEAEQLAECIRIEAGKRIAVLGIEPFGGAINSSYPVDFFVKCACKTTNLQFVVKSFEHWKDINQHAIVRLCKLIYNFFKS